MTQTHSTHYILELKLKEDKKKWYVYAQGISPLLYNFQDIQCFQIFKQSVIGTEFQRQNITYRFLQFQQSVRERICLKKLFWKYWRKLETGEVTWQSIKNQK